MDDESKRQGDSVENISGLSSNKSSQQIDLPDWVAARLRQDNQDLSRSIVDMVIWVDRVKCWMYQTDADLALVLRDLGAGEEPQL